MNIGFGGVGAPAALPGAAAPGAHLQPDCVLMFPLHVVDVPGDSLHRVYGIEYHIVAFCVLVKVIFYFLKKKKKTKLVLFYFSPFIQ